MICQILGIIAPNTSTLCLQLIYFLLKGLNAEMLQEFPYFSKTEAKLINAFLDRLVKPACLIAHDGIQFDFIHLDRHFKSVVSHKIWHISRISSEKRQKLFISGRRVRGKF